MMKYILSTFTFLFLALSLQAQNVGVGTNAPTYKLDVVGDIGHDEYMYHNNDANTYWRFQNDQIQIRAGNVRMVDFIEGGSDYVVFNENGANLDFRVESDNQNDMFMIDASTNRIGFNTLTPSNVIDFRTTGENIWLTYWENNHASAGATAQFVHTNAGNGNRVLMGATQYTGSANIASAVIGLALGASGSGGDGVHGFCNSTAGTGTYGGFVGGTSFAAAGWAVYSDGWAGGTTAWQNVSDRRLKKNINTLDGALSKVMQLRGVEYHFDKTNYPDVNLDTETKQIGFIAQEVADVFPNIVREANLFSSTSEATRGLNEKRNTYKVKTLSYATIVPVLVEAIKEQQAIIEEQNQRIEALEKKMSE